LIDNSTYEVDYAFDFLTEDKNTHLEHLEDDIINNGFAGGQNAVNFLQATADLLSGNSNKAVNITTKWDGAPAIVCGPHPENGKFFVGTKSVFNKTPKVNFSVQDIKNNHTGEVANILQDCLRYLSTIGMKEILQGDLLYRNSTLKKTTYKSASGKSEQMISFQPNTIVYMVPEASGLGRKINSSKLGIIFHTTYKGKSIDKLKASFGANVSKLRRTPSVFFDDASYKDVSGNATMTIGEMQQFKKTLNMAVGSLKQSKELLNKIKSETNTLSVGVQLKTYLNSFIRAATDLPSTKETATKFRKFYEDRTQKEIDRVKTDKAKEKYNTIQKLGLKFIDGQNKQIYFACATYKTLQTAKAVLISKLNKSKSIGTFKVTPKGLQATNPEGYVAVDKSGKAVKLVDRLEFSVQNFTAAKNWDKGPRNVNI
jgi:hypothetical protein|tara:strand:- start:184 stop:1464 length:1281 start_codon:yes stop_codon:yes gene_type:complete